MMRRRAAVENIQFPTVARAAATSPEALRCSSGPPEEPADVRPIPDTHVPDRLVVVNQPLFLGSAPGGSAPDGTSLSGGARR